MHSAETTYHLAASSKDYRACHNLAQEVNGKPDDNPYSFPTVYAKRGGKVIGFFATVQDDRNVIAGPLVIQSRRSPIVAMRLMEAYDLIMAQQGVTLYYFTVDAQRTDALSRERLEAMGMEYWETVENVAWFKRHLKSHSQTV